MVVDEGTHEVFTTRITTQCMKEAPLLSDVLQVLQHGLLELRKIANDPERGDQRWALADALHNLPAYNAGRLRRPGRPPKRTRLGVSGSRELHDEYLLAASIDRLRNYVLKYPTMFNYVAMTEQLVRSLDAKAASRTPSETTNEADVAVDAAMDRPVPPGIGPESIDAG